MCICTCFLPHNDQTKIRPTNDIIEYHIPCKINLSENSMVLNSKSASFFFRHSVT